MMTSNFNNRHSNNIDDTTLEAVPTHAIGVLVTLDYPSLTGNCWDDELLPSGD